jgi:hypothetical protein
MNARRRVADASRSLPGAWQLAGERVFCTEERGPWLHVHAPCDGVPSGWMLSDGSSMSDVSLRAMGVLMVRCLHALPPSRALHDDDEANWEVLAATATATPATTPAATTTSSAVATATSTAGTATSTAATATSSAPSEQQPTRQAASTANAHDDGAEPVAASSAGAAAPQTRQTVGARLRARAERSGAVSTPDVAAEAAVDVAAEAAVDVSAEAADAVSEAAQEGGSRGNDARATDAAPPRATADCSRANGVVSAGLVSAHGESTRAAVHSAASMTSRTRSFDSAEEARCKALGEYVCGRASNQHHEAAAAAVKRPAPHHCVRVRVRVYACACVRAQCRLSQPAVQCGGRALLRGPRGGRLMGRCRAQRRRAASSAAV